MHKFKAWLFNLFHFNKQERNGVFVLLIIIVFLFGVKLLMPVFLQSNQASVQLITISPTLQETIQTTIDTSFLKELSEKPNIKSVGEKQLFVFNPNTINSDDAAKLGLSKKLISTLINFRNKGGKFFKAEDFKKLYGLSPQLYNRLEAYILIPNHRKDTILPSRTFVKQTKQNIVVDINAADSSMIVAIKGIGPGFTKRIIKYRAMLGGFHSVTQLREVYGMTDSLYNLLTSQVMIDKNNIAKIPINAIDFNSLRKHLYFNFQTAQAVINYRNKHGRLTEADIKGLGIFSEEKLTQILPYIIY